jgi:hypothetical protein
MKAGHILVAADNLEVDSLDSRALVDTQAVAAHSSQRNVLNNNPGFCARHGSLKAAGHPSLDNLAEVDTLAAAHILEVVGSQNQRTGNQNPKTGSLLSHLEQDNTAHKVYTDRTAAGTGRSESLHSDHLERLRPVLVHHCPKLSLAHRYQLAHLHCTCNCLGIYSLPAQMVHRMDLWARLPRMGLCLCRACCLTEAKLQ